MMTICYSYVLSLLFLLLITHWTNTASLLSFSRSSSKWPLDHRHPPSIINNEVITPEPILSRRRPLLPSSERRRRWAKDEDDEVEIPIDETSTTTIDNKSTVLINNLDENSTMISTITEVKHRLLRQDLAEINQTDELTTISINEENSQNNDNLTTIDNIFPSTIFNEINSTESEILPTNVTEINQVISNEKNEFITDTFDHLTTIESTSNETETSSTPISLNQNIEETSIISQTVNNFQQDAAITLLDYTTIPPAAANDNQISIDSEFNSTVIDESNNITTILDATQNDTTVTDQGLGDITTISDVTQNDTSTIITDEDEYLDEIVSPSPKTTAKPICDRSCQCSKQCPYGFEIINNTCQCDPPCKNYQCFGNDTCTVTKKGQPLCRPENGSEHDRPIRCYQPRDAGYHDVSIRYHNRWYYNPDQDTCHLFVYRGLGGNENNFQTLHECHVECITCAPSPDPGTCLGYIRMWYYDYKKKQCSQFEYTGCKGNENKFLRKQECIDTCVTRIINL